VPSNADESQTNVRREVRGYALLHGPSSGTSPVLTSTAKGIWLGATFGHPLRKGKLLGGRKRTRGTPFSFRWCVVVRADRGRKRLRLTPSFSGFNVLFQFGSRRATNTVRRPVADGEVRAGLVGR